MISRRTFISSLAASLLAAPLAAAQPVQKVYRVGVLLAASAASVALPLDALRQGLREHGYVSGQNLVIDVQASDMTADRLQAAAAALLRSNVDVLVTWTTPATLAAKRATSTTPIVMVSIGDPLGVGLVASLGRPGGNVTGVSNISRDLSGKQLEFLREILTGTVRIAVLRNPSNPSSALMLRETQAAATALGFQVQLLEARSAEDIERAVAAMVRQGAAGIVVLADALFLAERDRLAGLAEKARLPTAFQRRENVEAGGLISYGPSLEELFRRAAYFVDRILKGAKPGDLPVEQPTKFELVINMKTAKALGLTIPPSVLGRADQVIE